MRGDTCETHKCNHKPQYISFSSPYERKDTAGCETHLCFDYRRDVMWLKSEIAKRKKRIVESVRQPLGHPAPGLAGQERSSTGRIAPVRRILAVNHALAQRSECINQTLVLVSLLVKDVAVRSYRTDPVQVRSCYTCSVSAL